MLNEKREKIEFVVNDLIKRIEDMPPGAMQIGINHYDYLTLLYILKAISDDDDEMIDEKNV